MFCHFWQKFENSKWPPFLGRGKYFGKLQRLHCLDPLPKNGGHFEFLNFCQKWQNTNLLLSRLTVKRDRSKFRRNFRPTGYLRNVIFAIFKKFSPPQKWRPFLGIFENFCQKWQRLQICFYLLNRAR